MLEAELLAKDADLIRLQSLLHDAEVGHHCVPRPFLSRKTL